MITTNSYSNNELYLEIYRRTESHDDTKKYISDMIDEIKRGTDPDVVLYENGLAFIYLDDLMSMQDIY